jgi:membrane associated rhomboid family serine protease
MIPLYDRNPTRTKPVVTMLLIAACVVIYLFVQPHDRSVEDAKFSYSHAAIPCEIVKGRPLADDEIAKTFQEGDSSACEDHPSDPPDFPGKNVYLAILYSMFLHGSLLHIGGNMLFLWVFGNNIEDVAGKFGYLAFYLAAGLVATFAQIALDPGSTVPMIGASGAIAGVMGAYLVLFPNVRIHSLIFLGFFVFFRDISAKWLLGIWFVTQFFTNPASGVAWMAHVGGFVFGVAAGLLWRVARPKQETQPVVYPQW